MAKSFTKKKKNTIPGAIVKCESGRYLAFYEHRTDIIANGENEKDALKNLRKMYKVVIEAEEEEKEKIKENRSLILPEKFKVKKFTEKLSRI